VAPSLNYKCKEPVHYCTTSYQFPAYGAHKINVMMTKYNSYGTYDTSPAGLPRGKGLVAVG
jgi:hypothetical protein